MKKETSYLDIASEIKKAKAEEEINDTVDEIITEDIAEAVLDEMPCSKKENRDETGKIEEIKFMVEDLNINVNTIEKREAKKQLIEYSNRINDIVKPYGPRALVEPKGEEGRNYEKEFDAFFEKIKNHLDEDQEVSDEEYIEKCSKEEQEITNEEYTEMCPTFIYPEIEKLDEEKLKETSNELEDIEKEINVECKNENTKKILDELLLSSNALIDFCINKKNGNDKNAFEQIKIVHNDINDNLCQSANDIYKEKLKFFKDRPEKGKLEKKLEDTMFDAQGIKTVLELALIKGKLSDAGYKVFIDKNITGIIVSTNRSGYDCPVILIPPDAEKNGLQLMRLVAHEIGRHVTTNIYNEKQGFNGTMGKGWNVVNEGISKRSEARVAKEMLKEEFCDFEISAEPYYILAMEKIRGEKNKNGEYKNGWNYAKTFKYIYNLKLREELYKNEYNNTKEQLDIANNDNEKKVLIKEIEKVEEKSKRIAKKIAKKNCLRTFKGFNPKEGGKYYPQDKIYFEGEVKMLELEEAESVEEFEECLRLLRVDPMFVPYLIRMGAYTDKKGLQIAEDVAKEIWKDKELPIKERMQGDKKYELFLPYLDEFMEKYYRDELYNFYDQENKNDE
ncbi:MAG: hypothetical protein KAQ87_04330 [Candidatus Pacebacteria bacterium]|nr:hypothetical protein [Candidatus Paceibacterota bacterium]